MNIYEITEYNQGVGTIGKVYYEKFDNEDAALNYCAIRSTETLGLMYEKVKETKARVSET